MEEFNPLDFGVSPARAISRFGEFDNLKNTLLKGKKKIENQFLSIMDSRDFRALKS